MELPILRDIYQLINWFLPKISKFPRNYRYSLGLRIENNLYDLLETIITARFSKKKKHYLEKANISLEVLRYFVRICNDNKLITVKHYEALSKQINNIGKQIGGWIKDRCS